VSKGLDPGRLSLPNFIDLCELTKPPVSVEDWIKGMVGMSKDKLAVPSQKK
jgi:hypothetical protein